MPGDWATSENIEAFEARKLPNSEVSGSRSISIDTKGNLALLGSSNGSIEVFSLSDTKAIHTYEGDGSAITDAIWSGSRAIVASSTGTIRVFDEDRETSSFTQHAGEATAVAIHPSGHILASVGIDKSIVFYDLSAAVVATQIFTDSGKSDA